MFYRLFFLIFITTLVSCASHQEADRTYGNSLGENLRYEFKR